MMETVSLLSSEELLQTDKKDETTVATMGNSKDSSLVLAKTKQEGNESAIKDLLNKLPELDSCFHIHKKIGEGTFSTVYLASLKGLNNKKQFAIKHLIPTCHPKRIQYELDCLERIGGKDNVVSCDLTIRQGDCVVFIMPYLAHHRFAEYVLEMSVEETRLYMKNLFLALQRVHSFNIIHRDVKPSNFLYNRESKQFLLVDFGLAQKVDPREADTKAVSIGTKVPNLKAPVLKRKREDDDVENAESPALKRVALQTLPNDLGNKPGLRFSKQPLSVQQRKCQQVQATLFSKRQPLAPASLNLPPPSTAAGQQRKCQEAHTALLSKRQALTSASLNLPPPHTPPTTAAGQKPGFQTLAPQKPSPEDKGASFVRVQNSQVQPTSLFPRPVAPVRQKNCCECDGRAQICNLCLVRKPQYAPRAGTPGYRPPEVLLKYPHQTTAVDIWSAGVIMLCILSGCYPFFRSPDDITGLTELITVFGSLAIKKLARKLGRNIVCQEERKPLSLWLLCENLRRRKTEGSKLNASQPKCPDCLTGISEENGCLCESNCKLHVSQSVFPTLAYDLLAKLLDLNADTRITAEQALQHPFITSV